MISPLCGSLFKCIQKVDIIITKACMYSSLKIIQNRHYETKLRSCIYHIWPIWFCGLRIPIGMPCSRGGKIRKKNPFLVQTIVQSIKYIHFWNIFTSFVLVSLRDIWGISMNMISGSRRVSPQIRNPITIERPQPISQITQQTQTNSHDTQGKDIVPSQCT